VQVGQRKCGSEMPPCADANRDGLPGPPLGESLAVSSRKSAIAGSMIECMVLREQKRSAME